MTIVLNESDKTKQSVIVNNLKRLNDMYDVVDATNINCHLREYALLKIAISEVDPEKIKELLNSDHSRILDEDDDVMIVELSGYESTVKNTIALLEKYDIVELMRLGKMAMVSGNDESYQPKLVKSDPSWTTHRLSTRIMQRNLKGFIVNKNFRSFLYLIELGYELSRAISRS